MKALYKYQMFCLILTLFCLTVAPLSGSAAEAARSGDTPAAAQKEDPKKEDNNACHDHGYFDRTSKGNCGTVRVDCAAHKITFDGITLPQSSTCENPGQIDCGEPGRPTVKGLDGKIGGGHCGPVVPDGVEIEGIQGMGASGGEKVFHTPNPKNENSCPSGSNNTWGCIAVCKDVLDKLKQCKGSPLQIVSGTEKADLKEPDELSSRQLAWSTLIERILWNPALEILQCSTAHAEDIFNKVRDTFPMAADQVIAIDSYDPLSRTYEVSNVEYWGQGPLIVSTEELANSVKAIKLSYGKVLRSPSSILHNEYKTDKVMTMLMPNVVNSRKKDHG